MPKVKTHKTRPPEGWELIEPKLEEFSQKMRDGESNTAPLALIVVSGE